VPDAEEAPGENPVIPLPGGGDATNLPAANRWLILFLWIAALALAAFAFQFANQRYALTTRAAEYILSATEQRGERNLLWVRNVALFVLADPFERAFHPVNLSLRWLGESPAPHLTPAERVNALKKILPEGLEEIETLLREYHSSQYSPNRGNLQLARRASRRLLWLGVQARIRRAQMNSRW
jgi:hypothetical protein